MASESGRRSGGRGSEGRGVAGRGSFTRVSRSAAFAAKGPQVSLATASRIVRAGDESKARVTARYAQQAEQRTNKAYDGLLGKHGPEPVLKPDGAQSDPKARLMARARALVAADLSRQISRIDRAQARMLKTGQVRGTRKLDWGRGLGD